MTIQPTVSDQTLDNVSARAFVFITAVANNSEVFAALATRGYTVATHNQGIALCDAAANRVIVEAPDASPIDTTVEAAVEELDNWDETNFAVARSALQHRFPAQCAYLFGNNLQAARGRGAVLSVKTFLRRCDDLDSSPEREATRADDHAALRLLAERGITPAVRAHLTERIAVVQGGVVAASATATPRATTTTEATATAPAPKTDEAKAAEDRARKMAMYVWLSEWTGIAHAVITKRRLLIALGIATLRKAKATANPVNPPAQ